MKLTAELKNRIDNYFNNLSSEEFHNKAVNRYGFTEMVLEVKESYIQKSFNWSFNFISLTKYPNGIISNNRHFYTYSTFLNYNPGLSTVSKPMNNSKHKENETNRPTYTIAA